MSSMASFKAVIANTATNGTIVVTGVNEEICGITYKTQSPIVLSTCTSIGFLKAGYDFKTHFLCNYILIAYLL